MNQSNYRREAARRLVADVTPLAQEISDYVFANPAFQGLGHGTVAAAFGVLGGGLAKHIGLPKGDVVLLVEAAWDDTEVAEKNAAGESKDGAGDANRGEDVRPGDPVGEVSTPTPPAND